MLCVRYVHTTKREKLILTRFPVESTSAKCGVMGSCSMAMKTVLSTIHIVMARSTNGSITIKFIISFIFIQSGKHSHIRNVLANLYQKGGHFLWESSSSAGTKRISICFEHQSMLYECITFKRNLWYILMNALDSGYFFQRKYIITTITPIYILNKNVYNIYTVHNNYIYILSICILYYFKQYLYSVSIHMCIILVLYKLSYVNHRFVYTGNAVYYCCV